MMLSLCHRALVVLGLALGFGLVACQHSTVGTTASTPQRVVSQVVLADAILWSLGPQAHERVVGVSSLVDDVRYSNAAGLWPKAVARIPGTAEALVAAHPDLVIVAEFTASETRHLLEQLNIRTIELSGFRGFADYRRHIRTVAQAMALREQGEMLVAEFDRELDELRRARAVVNTPTVVSYNDGMVAGSDTIFEDQAQAAGLVNAATVHGVTGHAPVALEQLAAWNPDYVVISCGDQSCDAAQAEFAHAPGISGTAAARNGRIIAIESRWLYSSGREMLRVVKILTRRKALQ